MSRRRRGSARKRSRPPRPAWLLPAVVAVVGVGIVVGLRLFPGTPGERIAPADGLDLPAVPEFDATDMEPQVARALVAARDAAEGSPGSAAAWGAYGILLDAHDLHEPATICYRAAHVLEPERPDWPYLLARALEIVGAPPAEYLPFYDVTLARSPSYAPAHVRYGDALLRAGRPEEAAQSFAAAISLRPGLAGAHRGLGRARLAAGDPPGARASLERAIELSPEEGTTWGFLAQALARIGDRAGAREAQGRARALEREPTAQDPILARVGDAGLSADQCLRRAKERLIRGDPVAAVRDLEIARAARPDDEYVRELLGGAYSQTGRLREAIAEFESALAIREQYPEAHRDYAGVLSSVGRFEDAVRHYRRSEELSEPDVDLVSRKAAAMAQAGDLPGALAEFERAAKLGPLDARAQLNWGTAWASSGRPDRAVEHFAEATRLDSGLVSAWANLGLARESVGDIRGAIEAWDEVLRLDPGHRIRARRERLVG